MNIIKRDGTVVPFNKTKIKQAVSLSMRNGSGIYLPDIARLIAQDAEKFFARKGTTPTIEQIEEYVIQRLNHYGQDLTAKAYAEYRAVQTFKRNTNTTDDSILSLVRGTNEEVARENSNKNARVGSTQRDLIAGEVSKDISRRKLIPSHIVQAHDTGAIHYHDMDYAMQPIFNCCIADIKDMLDNGTVINGKMVESPKSFQVACTVMTQIIAQIASGQYGGQTMNVKHLGKYLARSRERLQKQLNFMAPDHVKKEIVDTLLIKELQSGVQTIQYQINTLMTTNGQAPFVTLFLEIEEGHEYEQEIAMIVAEIIRQRYQGIKNEKGVYVTPSFPKLVYVLDENTIQGGKYHWITKEAVKCSAKRLYPDYVSAKKMRENYEGNVFGMMGCRAFLSPWKDAHGNYKFEGRFNMGVITLNLPQIAIIADGDMEVFWEVLEQRLALVKEALMVRYNLLKDATSDISPIHWQHGALARLDKHEPILPLLKDGYATITMGYIGLYEATKLMTGKSHTVEKQFSLDILKRLKAATVQWKEEEKLGFALYGTPAESLCHRFAKIDLARFGSIKDVTDKGYYTNSYHVDVRENIDAFSKLEFESEYQNISTGGCISYVEIPNMSKNLEALEQIVEYIYNNITYAEFNTKSDYCHVCEFDQEILINEDNEWECPQCGNKDHAKMNVTRRTCGLR